MVVDSSTIYAIVLDEPEAGLFADLLMNAKRPMISAATMVEVEVVALRRFAGRLDPKIQHVIASLDLRVMAVTPGQSAIARTAYRRYGVGSGHRARLNFGDCFAYALAIEVDQPLLFKGDDFIHTDVKQAIPR